MDTAWGKVSVDNQEPIEFTNKDNLTLNGLAGSDVINLNNPFAPAGQTAGSFLANIYVNGGDPTGVGAGDTLVANGTTNADTINFAPTAADGGNIAGAGAVPITFSTIEQVEINGQGGGDSLTVTTPAGQQIVTVIPGAWRTRGR